MSFEDDIIKFNRMYGMPVATHPTVDQLGVNVVKRLQDLKVILQKELNEIDDIIGKAEALTMARTHLGGRGMNEIEVLTDIADLMGDLQVYCASEMAKFGLPWGCVLSTIMESNFSKMGADGQPIYDANGKLDKGPNYWKPEPAIAVLIQKHIDAHLLPANNPSPRFVSDSIGAFDPLPIKN